MSLSLVRPGVLNGVGLSNLQFKTKWSVLGVRGWGEEQGLQGCQMPNIHSG